MDAISEIKQRLDIVTVISQYVQLKKSGRNYKGVCPFHSENTPSFMVTQELQIFKCFGCGATGDMFGFVQQIEGIDFHQALENLAERAGVKLENREYDSEINKQRKRIFHINDLTTRFYNYLLTSHKIGAIGKEYVINKRKLTEKTIADFMIGYAPDNHTALIRFLENKQITKSEMVLAGVAVEKDNGEIMDKFRGRVVFPFTGIDGKIVGFTGRTVLDRDPKYLNTSETPVFHKSKFIFGLDKARVEIKKLGAIFVEGQMDTIAAHQFGITNVVATSGTSMTEDHLQILSRYTSDITFCFDSDSAGVNAINRGIELAEKQGFNIKVAIIPKPYKDIDELLQHDEYMAKQIFINAVPAYDFYLYATLKKFDKTSPEGKKRIMDELTPRFGKLTNKILFDHYAKAIAVELGVSEETIVSVLNKEKQLNYQETPRYDTTIGSGFTISKQNAESYIISILLKSDLDIARSMGYKLSPEDFVDKDLAKIYSVFIEHISGINGNYHPQDIESKLSTDLKKKFSDLYLWEDPNVESATRDIALAIERLIKESSKRRMKDITEKIRIAEKSGDNNNLKVLMDEFNKLKGLLK